MSGMPGVAVASNRWLTCFRNGPAVDRRLFCVPYAGGGPQVFQSWPAGLPCGVEVCCLNLPGRGRRIAEAPFSELGPLIDEASRAVFPLLDKPFALFGHSMGALISFEMARTLRRQAGALPVHLFVSGCFAPHLPDPHPMHHLPQKEFLAELRSLNGVPQEVLENDELMELVLPALRADFTATETYVHISEAPLSCPITAFSGAHDPLTTRELVQEWRVHTSSGFSFRMLPGDHFFLVSQHQLLLSIISSELAKS